MSPVSKETHRRSVRTRGMALCCAHGSLQHPGQPGRQTQSTAVLHLAMGPAGWGEGWERKWVWVHREATGNALERAREAA